jgi:chorismate mutase
MQAHDAKEVDATVNTLENVRRELVDIDRRIIGCLARRQALVEEVVITGQPADEITDPVLHAYLLARVQGLAIQVGLSPALAQGVYLAILNDAIPRQLRLLGRSSAVRRR